MIYPGPTINEPNSPTRESLRLDLAASAAVKKRIRSAIIEALSLAGDPDSQVALDETMESQLWDAIRDPEIAAALARIASHGMMLREERGDS